MALRQKTKYKRIYKIGDTYYVSFYDGNKRVSKNGEEYLVKVEKKVQGKLDDALKFKVQKEEEVRKD